MSRGVFKLTFGQEVLVCICLVIQTIEFFVLLGVKFWVKRRDNSFLSDFVCWLKDIRQLVSLRTKVAHSFVVLSLDRNLVFLQGRKFGGRAIQHGFVRAGVLSAKIFGVGVVRS